MNGTQQNHPEASYPEAATRSEIPNQTPTGSAPYPIPPKAPVTRKSPGLATVLSMMPGLGQIYVGYYQQGFIFVLVPAAIIAVLSSGAVRGLVPFLAMFLAFFWIFNMVDANRRALHYNRVAEGLGGQELPEGFALPGAKGSAGGGILLIVVGILLFLDLKAGISLEWLAEWWPLGLVGSGAWLVLKARRQAE